MNEPKYKKGTWIGHVSINNRAVQVWIVKAEYSQRRKCNMYELCIDTAIIIRSESDIDEIFTKNEIKDYGIFKPRK